MEMDVEMEMGLRKVLVLNQSDWFEKHEEKYDHLPLNYDIGCGLGGSIYIAWHKKSIGIDDIYVTGTGMGIGNGCGAGDGKG
jgi:hypothetical protein